MKRCFSLALILALLLGAISCPALTEEAEIVSGNVEAEVAPAETAGDTGLTVDGATAPVPQADGDDAPGILPEEGPEPSEGTQDPEAVEAEPEADVPDAAQVEAEEALPVDPQETPSEVPKDNPATVAITVSPSKISVGIGETYEGLRAQAQSAGSALPRVTWATSSKKIATVDADTGAITGVRQGTCSVTATAENGKTATCTVTVGKKPDKITLSQSALSLSVGMTVRLKSYLHSGCASAARTFTSSNLQCVSVDEKGRVTAIAPGSATVTVSTYNGKTAKCKVSVSAAPADVRVRAGEAISIAVDQKVSLKAAATDASGASTPADITYAVDKSSPDAGCVKLNADSGSVRGVRRGQAVVTATTHNGLVARCIVTVDVAPKSVSLNKSHVSVGQGEKYAGLSAKLTPPNGSGTCATAVSWTSSDKTVAKVDSAGVVTGVKTGTCTITVKAAGSKTASCTVTVAKKPGRVTLSESALSLSVGMTVRLKSSVPSGCASAARTFTSSNLLCAPVDKKGWVTALSPGSATVTVSTYNGRTATCKVSVSAAPSDVRIRAGEAVSVAVGQKISLKAAATDASGASTPADITYAVDKSSPDAGCIKLNAVSGSVKGVRRGQAVVTATTHNGLVARCTVTVDVAPEALKLNKDSLTVGTGEAYAGLSATLTPPKGSSTCATAVTWASSDKTVAKVDSTGIVTGVKAGACTITVSTANGLTASCAVTVKKAPTGISVSPEVGALKVGQTGQYRISLTPADSASRLFYKSSNSGVADVDDDGFVTAVAPGEVTITVSTFNGLSRTVSLVVSKNDDDGGGNGGDDSGKTSSDNAKKLEYVISVAQSQLGKPYVYGSGYSKISNPRGFDCSGLVYWCFLHIDIKLKDTAYRQGYDDSLKKITNKSDLRRGDLVFFNTVSDSDLSDHSGLYLGNGKFIHASSGAGKVVVSDMSQSGSYYDRVFSWGRRVLE